VYSLGPQIPSVQLNSPEADTIIRDLITHLEMRIAKRQQLEEDMNNRLDSLRMSLLQNEKDNITLKTENIALKELLNQDRQKVSALENKILIYERSIDDLNRKNQNLEYHLSEMELRLNEKSSQLSQKELEKEKQRRKFNSKLNVEKEKGARELEQKLREQKSKMEQCMKDKEEKLRLVSEIISSDTNPSSLTRSNSVENINATPSSNANARTPRGVPVANIRYRRSRSAGERWLEHRPQNPVPVGTILQPYYGNRKSVTKMTDAKDVMNSKNTKYCLIDQEADTDGELETRLYKGNVIPTTGGGAQVIFDDVECLKQMSPLKSPSRKRTSQTTPSTPNDLQSKCSVGIEGHSSKKPRI
jgi:kinesin family protein 23